MVAQTCNPSPGEVEAGGAEVQSHPWLQVKNSRTAFGSLETRAGAGAGVGAVGGGKQS